MSLLVTAFLDRVRDHAPDREIVDYVDGTCVRRSTYREYDARVRRLAGALRALGVQPGDRVATFCWNSQEHLELYLAVPCVGAVLHTVNVRLYDDDLDPDQLVNRIDDPAYAAVRAALEERRSSLITCAGWLCNQTFGALPEPGAPPTGQDQ